MGLIMFTSSPLFAMLLIGRFAGALPVHLLGTVFWGALILRAEAASYASFST